VTSSVPVKGSYLTGSHDLGIGSSGGELGRVVVGRLSTSMDRRTVQCKEAQGEGAVVNNVQLARDAYEAFGRGDIPAVLGMMDPDIEWSEAEGNPYKPDGKPWLGPDAVLNSLFIKLGTEWDGFTVTPREFYDAGSAVVVEARYTGVYKETGKRCSGLPRAEMARRQAGELPAARGHRPAPRGDGRSLSMRR